MHERVGARMGLKPVMIEDYSDEWPVMFAEIETVLRQQLRALALSVEHVGSTSVPGLAAKPIIDIDVIIESRTILPRVIDLLNKLGYDHEGNLGIEDREVFARNDDRVPYCKQNIRKQEHHLYVCSKESPALKNHLRFRDILREYPHLVEEYGSLKKELAVKYRDNRQAYTEAKTLFVTTVMNKYSS